MENRTRQKQISVLHPFIQGLSEWERQGSPYCLKSSAFPSLTAGQTRSQEVMFLYLSFLKVSHKHTWFQPGWYWE